MADVSFNKEKRKRTFRKFDKESEFETDKMKTPVYFSKRGLSYKSQGHEEANNCNSTSSGFWDKKSSRMYHSDDHRGRHSNKSWLTYDNAREDRFNKNDTGRPPGSQELADFTPVITPVILTRERDSNEVHSAVSTLVKDNATSKPEIPTPPTKQYQIASKPNVLEAIVIPEQVMSSSVKFLDESFLMGDELNPFLLDQNHFFVVAVVGLQACGKSTIASLLADPSKADKLLSSSSWIFRPENRDEVLRGCHATNGVDVFVTKDRVIILDLQPLLSPSVMDYIVNQDRKASLDYSSSTENLLEVESLQLLTFAMNVSHVLVVVQDYIFHPNIIRMLHTSQMMKPSYSIHNSVGGGHGTRDDISRSAYDSSDSQQYFPHLVFIHNRSSPHHFMPKFVEDLQALYQTALADSSLCIESQIGIGSGTFPPPLTSAKNNVSINLFLIPDIHYEDKCAVSFEESILEMRRQLFSLSRCPMTHVTLTEKSCPEAIARRRMA